MPTDDNYNAMMVIIMTEIMVVVVVVIALYIPLSMPARLHCVRTISHKA